jgi:hypothetical protein
MITYSSAARWARGVAAAVGLVSAAAAFGIVAPTAGAASPTLTITPGGSAYQNGASIDISVGPNSLFAPDSRIIVIECAAPKGVLPVDDTTCDGNTVQSGSVLVNSNGSFEVPGYTLYALPNTALGEAADSEPVCNGSAECALYIGQNQNDFSQPKIFSSPFTVDASATSTPTTLPHPTSPGKTGSVGPNPTGGSGGTGGSSASTGSAASGSAGAAGAGSSGGSDPDSAPGGSSAHSGGVLAFTGIVDLPWLLGIGTGLVLLGVAGRWRRKRTLS